MNRMHRLIAVGLGLVCLTAPAWAHHSFDTEYDRNKKVALTGVVTKIEWTNPHMHIYIDVTGADGTVTNWNMEMASPNAVQRQGWTRSALLAGEKVVFEGSAGKVIETRAALTRIAKADSPDKVLFRGYINR